MTPEEIEKLKFPVGKFIKPEHYTHALTLEWIETIEQFPAKIAQLISALNTEQLNWKYRPEGWKIKQVVHHCADSHMNSLMRFKITLTEELPTIRAYSQSGWAELVDSTDDNIEDSLLFLKSLHRKWVKILKNLSATDLEKILIHPEGNRRISLNELIGIYAWHCRHHTAHIEQALQMKFR